MAGDVADAILVWGGGAIGGTVAAHLVRAGHDVVLVDVDEVHLAAIRAEGLAVSACDGPFTIRLPALHPREVEGRFRTVLLAVKANVTRVAAKALLPCLTEDAAVVSLQNGLCEVEIAEEIGAERTVGAFINFGADVTGPGTLVYGNRGAVVVGEIDGVERPRTTRLLALLRDFERDTVLTGNIWGYLWGKQGYSAILKASALSTDTMVGFITDPALKVVHVTLVREILAVAAAAGVQPLGFNGFDPDAFASGDLDSIDRSIEAMAAFNRASTKTHSSAWRDLAIFHRPTDALAQLAPVFALAEEHGIAVPCARRMIELIQAIEVGEARQGDAPVEELRRIALAVETRVGG